MKKRRMRRQTVFLTAFGVLLTLTVAAVFLITAPRENAAEPPRAVGHREEESGTSSSEMTLPSGSVTMALAGDVTFGLDMADFIRVNGPEYPWSEISSLIRGYRFAVVNLEGPLCREGTTNPDQPSYPIRGEVACAGPMAAAGVDVVCLANDHAMDYGSQGLEEALNVLRNAGISCVGAGSSREAAQRPLVLEDESGVRIALLSFCDVAPPSYAAEDSDPGIARADPETMDKAIRGASEENPYVVVFLHWGEIGSADVTTRQRELASVCVRAGADLVVGCHPHLVQPMELLEGVPVFYSLGNLVYFSRKEEGRRGIVLGCLFREGRVAEIQVFPQAVENGRPVAMDASRAVGFLQEWAQTCRGARPEISALTGTASLLFNYSP